MSYLLDANIVSYFLQAGRQDDLAGAAKRCSMAVVEDVRRELENAPDRGGGTFKKWLATSNIDVRSILVGSPASITFADLLNPTAPNKNRGELASIALAAEDASLTLVTNDKGAVLIALREIWMPGERIMGLAVFLRRLFDQSALEDPGALDDVIKVARAQRPTWWASWHTGLVSRSTNSASEPALGGAEAPEPGVA